MRKPEEPEELVSLACAFLPPRTFSSPCLSRFKGGAPGREGKRWFCSSPSYVKLCEQRGFNF
eukprot:1316470-Amorphochlora_amoeboformis.AAC.1